MIHHDDVHPGHGGSALRFRAGAATEESQPEWGILGKLDYFYGGSGFNMKTWRCLVIWLFGYLNIWIFWLWLKLRALVWQKHWWFPNSVTPRFVDEMKPY